MVTLDDVKNALNIDFPDQDQYLTTLLNGAVHKAEIWTGRNYTISTLSTYEPMPEDVQKAVIQDVASDYANRDNFGGDGAESTANNASIYTYRQNSTNPMF
ncbi:head-tail connector protein [Sphingobacterium sp.]|uniref:head-tail connector protein n=1 Tax=Sphingobacterium sp. TaxID=341027 RepID=UPI002898218C|nr:head-tail connector protein [Sphingobacterium sp.]